VANRQNVGDGFAELNLQGSPVLMNGAGIAGADLTSGESILPRLNIASTAVVAATSGTLFLSYFTAQKTESVGNLKSYTGGTAAGATPTLCRIGIYTVASNGDIALAGAIANDTTLWAASFTLYTRAITTPFTKTAGQRYAWGQLCVTGATAPTFAGTGNTLVPNSIPRVWGTLAGQTDLPASVANGSLTYPTTGSMVYGELLP